MTVEGTCVWTQCLGGKNVGKWQNVVRDLIPPSSQSKKEFIKSGWLAPTFKEHNSHVWNPRRICNWFGKLFIYLSIYLYTYLFYSFIHSFILFPTSFLILAFLFYFTFFIPSIFDFYFSLPSEFFYFFLLLHPLTFRLCLPNHP